MKDNSLLQNSSNCSLKKEEIKNRRNTHRNKSYLVARRLLKKSLCFFVCISLITLNFFVNENPQIFKKLEPQIVDASASNEGAEDSLVNFDPTSNIVVPNDLNDSDYLNYDIDSADLTINFTGDNFMVNGGISYSRKDKGISLKGSSSTKTVKINGTGSATNIPLQVKLLGVTATQKDAFLLNTAAHVVLRVEQGENSFERGGGHNWNNDGTSNSAIGVRGNYTKLTITSNNPSAKLIARTTCTTDTTTHHLYAPAIGENSSSNDDRSINICGNANVEASVEELNTSTLGITGYCYASAIGFDGSNKVNIGGNARVRAAAYAHGKSDDGVIKDEHFGLNGSGICAKDINIGGNSTVAACACGYYTVFHTAGGIRSTSTTNIGGNASVAASTNSHGNDANKWNYGSLGAGIRVAPDAVCNIGGNANVLAGCLGNRTWGSAIGGYDGGTSGNISISGGFVVAQGGQHNNSEQDIGRGVTSDEGGLTKITGGSVYPVRNKVSSPVPASYSGEPAQRLFVSNTVGSATLKGKILEIPLGNNKFYRAPLADESRLNAIENLRNLANTNITSNGMHFPSLTSLFPSNTICALVFVPKGEYDQISATYTPYTYPFKPFKATIENDTNDYTSNTNYLAESSSPLEPPTFVPSDMPIPSVDGPAAWYNQRAPTLTGNGTPWCMVCIINRSSPTKEELGNAIVDENGRWKIQLSELPDGVVDIGLYQTDEFFHRRSSDQVKTIGIDVTSPTARIVPVNAGIFETILNTLTLNFFFKDRAHIQIIASDNLSGVEKIEYAITENQIEDTEGDKQRVLDLNYILATDVVDGQVTLNFNIEDGFGPDEFKKSFFIYLRITDAADNKYYVNSDQMTIYVDSGGGSPTPNPPPTDPTNPDIPTPTPTLPVSPQNPDISTPTPTSPGGASTSSNTPVTEPTEKQAETREVTNEVIGADSKYFTMLSKLNKGSLKSFRAFEVSGDIGDYFEIDLGDEFGKVKTYVAIYNLDRVPFDGEIIEGEPYKIRGILKEKQSVYAIIQK